MNSHPIPEFAVLGHPNEGKSAVVSTLAEDDSVKVSPMPGETLVCRVFPVRIDGREIIRFTDTPGFQHPLQTLKWMEAYDGPEQKRVAAFRAANQGNPDLKHECELFMPVEQGAGIIFVVDGSRPVRKNDRMEMEILRLIGRPRLAIINSKGHDEEFLDAWKSEFRKTFNAVRVFNAHNANYQERISLLESLKAIDQDWQPALTSVISVFKQDWKNRNIRVAEIICDLLVKCLTYSLGRNYSDEIEARTAKAKLSSAYEDEISHMEQKAFNRIRQVFKHHLFDLRLPSQSVLSASLFSSRTWQVLGLSPLQLAAAAGISGGMIGVGLDAAASGITFGLFTAIGSVFGAGVALLFGEQVSRARVVGVKLGGYRVSIGPNENMNFPYILLDRALILYSHVINRAHGRRDYPEQEYGTIGKNEKTGFTWELGTGEKKICRSFFQAIRKDDDLKMEKMRKKMIDLLLDIMEKISKRVSPMDDDIDGSF